MSRQLEQEVGRAMLELNAIDLLILSYETERATNVKRMERYGESKSQANFKRAQKAAIRGDKCEDAIKDLTRLKNYLKGRWTTVLTKFLGDERKAEIMLAYLELGMDAELAIRVTGCSNQEMWDVISIWERLLYNEQTLATRRLMHAVNQGTYLSNIAKTETWWVDPYIEACERKKETAMAKKAGKQKDEEYEE